MKKLLFVLLVALISVPSTWAKGQGTFSISVSPLFSDLLNISNVPDSTATGFGGYLYADYQVLNWMSLGIGAGETAFKKNSVTTYLESLDVMGRLILSNKGCFQPYLIGGLGYRPLMKDKDNYWQGHYHGMAGIGGRLDLNKSGCSGLDISLVANAYSPKTVIVKTGDIRVGYSIAFGGKGKKTQAAKKPAAPKVGAQATPVAGAAWWPMPFSAPTAFAKLKNDIIPANVAAKKTEDLKNYVNPFFAKLKETGVKDQEYKDYVAGYFTALAVSFNKNGEKARAVACVDKALQTSPTNKEALAVKASLAGAAAPVSAAPATSAPTAAAAATTEGAWIPTPFVASTAFDKLKTDIVPKYVATNQLANLGKEAKPFFTKLVAAGVKGQELNNYKAGYYVAIAENLAKKNDNTRASYYVDNALKVSPTDKDALALKAKLPATAPAAAPAAK